ncbi:hypothetical protein L1987_47516 [Smallanthus sonchifolius]|uniref:Uncharacterized protein n=1 Tax=Smallanthus sonchifolius TaxID=185202 RepID=A0ACB9G256_9ASTR|nr:hypothetical protein L1987_47516 [Smallanthus sonchifolius]
MQPIALSVLYISTAIVPVGISGSNSPVQPPAYMPPSASPVYAKPAPPPSINPSLEAPSESPADALEYSGESPPKAKRLPPKVAGPPATSAGGDTSDFGIGVYVVSDGSELDPLGVDGSSFLFGEPVKDSSDDPLEELLDGLLVDVVETEAVALP